jgi:hypothetical protein
MNQDEVNFLTNMKLIYQHGVSHSKGDSKLHRLLAIHNCHYVVEQIVREKARDVTFSKALHDIGFEEIIKEVHKKQNIPDYNRLLELNNIRNSAEHFFIIPDVDTVRFYVRVTGDFLRWSFKIYFNIEYDSLTFENRIYDAPIRRVMFEAKDSIGKGDLAHASNKMYEGLGAFKFMWFQYLSDPRVMGMTYTTDLGTITFTNLLADLAFKIILGEDMPTLRKILSIGTDFIRTKEGVIVSSNYNPPSFESKDKAQEDYDEILNIILTYQDRVPIWRDK